MKKPRILIWDLETNGVNARHPDLGFVICFGYKWVGEKKVHCLTFDKFGGYTKHGYSDKKLLIEATKLFNKADVIVAHYGDYFDKKFINGRLLINGLKPVPPVKQIDTCKWAWKYLNMSTARLVNLAKTLGVKNQKQKNGFPEWWLSIMAGDKKALRLCAEYCKADVLCLEDVYLAMRPLALDHVRLYDDIDVCGVCGGKMKVSKSVVTFRKKLYHRSVCTKCGHWDRSTKEIE